MGAIGLAIGLIGYSALLFKIASLMDAEAMRKVQMNGGE